MDRFELFNRFANCSVTCIKGNTGIIYSIARECGSGYDFNVTMTVKAIGGDYTKVTVYLNCRKDI